MRIIDAAGRITYAGGIDDDPLGTQAAPVNYVAKALDELLAGQAVATPLARPCGCSVKYAPIMH
jgi:dihydroxyacetone kinase DhaKLM complex PTS-EIIA-like component DhaM